ncbi:MAG: DNA translocase FtsK [Dehalococcoidia bacterium]|nr:DNA translocase FtsK [Dehalococcoidia bacterium]
MAARSGTRPRVSRSRKRKSQFSLSRVNQPEVFGVLAAVAALIAILFLVDVQSAVANTRDWILETFGVGIFVVLTWVLLGAAALWQGWYERGGYFWRKAAGVAALGLFIWGLFALNNADWSTGSVRLKDTSLGGEIGQAFVAGVLGKIAWLGAGVLAAGLLAPTASRWVAVNLPYGAQEAWRRRYPHRTADALGRWFSFALRRPDGEKDEVVIGLGGFRPLEPVPAGGMEGTPVVFRPSVDPASPSSTVGAGAAASFAAPVRDDPAVEAEFEEAIEEPAAALMEEDEEPAEPQQLGLELAGRSGWQLPAIEMLNAPIPSVHRKHDNAARAQLIVDTLASFGVDATVVEINEGPTVTQFGVEPGWEVKYKDVPLRDETGKQLYSSEGRPRTERVETARTRVRVNKITALQNDLALALAAPSLRIEAPVPGRAIVGIEVPNDSASVVTMRAVMETKEFQDMLRKSKLSVPLGKGVSGVPVVADLGKMPHLLIAGATGSGKSVCMNAIISGIMMNASPDDVRFVMVDPKRVELSAYSGIPHMAFSEVIVDMDKVVGVLQAVVGEMDARYKKFANVAVRNIESYNKHPRILKKLPYWVVIIDELADLMMAAPFEVEKLICRLAQLARATGIHLVVATQRPSVDVVTGLIKANFPTRIAFAVTSMTDSRTILDMGGAEKLLGRGDMLFMPTDAAKPIRIQGVYLSDTEVERLVEFWKDERFSELTPDNADDLLEQALADANGGDANIEVDFDDPVVDRARELTIQHQRVSPSLFQRRLKVGALKANKIIEILEEEGLVGPREEGESRRVLVGTPDGLA